MELISLIMPDNKTHKYEYQAFGLNIRSEFEIPEMYPHSFSEADLIIRFGEVPGEIEEIEKQGVRYQLSRKEFLLQVDGIANYHVKEGHQITISKQNEATLQEVSLFLLGPVFSGLLYLRNSVSLHGSALRHQEGTFLICGNSGAGKSTLTKEFINKGYQLLADDLSVLSKDNENILVQPSFPFIKLWKDALDHLQIPEKEGIRLREKLEKYGFPLQKEYYPHALPVQKIFILVSHNKPEFMIEELKGVEKFNTLKNHTYRYQFILDNTRPVHFQYMNQLASQAEVIRIRRPQAPINTTELREHIESMLEK